MELIKGKLRKVLNRALKMSNYELNYHSRCAIPIRVTNVRMYIDNDRWAIYKYRFEVDVEASVPTYDGSPVSFRYSDDRYIAKLLRGRLTYQLQGLKKSVVCLQGMMGILKLHLRRFPLFVILLPHRWRIHNGTTWFDY